MVADFTLILGMNFLKFLGEKFPKGERQVLRRLLETIQNRGGIWFHFQVAFQFECTLIHQRQFQPVSFDHQTRWLSYKEISVSPSPFRPLRTELFWVLILFPSVLYQR